MRRRAEMVDLPSYEECQLANNPLATSTLSIKENLLQDLDVLFQPGLLMALSELDLIGLLCQYIVQ